MHDEIFQIISRFEEVSQELNSGQIKDPDTIKKFNIELSKLSKLYPKAVEYKKNDEDARFAEESLKTTSNQEEINYFKEIINNSKEIATTIIDEIRQIKKEEDSNDNRNALIEIRAGTGGEEASLFAGDLYRMYLRYAEKQGWQIEQITKSVSASDGLKEVIALISGKGVYGKLKYESGVHRVQRVPSTESSGRIHTSSASVVVLPEVQDVEVELKEEDIKIDVFRSGGAGGQSVNTTDSAVRITHLPTNIVVSCQDERSQLKNKHRALGILKSKLFDLKIQEMDNNKDQLRKNSIKTGDRSEKIRTYNFPQSRVTDHRIKVSWYNLQNIMEGDIDSILETLNKQL